MISGELRAGRLPYYLYGTTDLKVGSIVYICHAFYSLQQVGMSARLYVMVSSPSALQQGLSCLAKRAGWFDGCQEDTRTGLECIAS